jgi:DNA-binding NarL/FixJ family response regulator
MTTVAEHVVGRAAELGALDLAVERLGSGGPAAVMLDGEPGIGKSRLLSELAARADARGCIVLSGSASELEADLPLWLFVDALEEYVAGLDPRRLESLDDGVRAELAVVFPVLSHLAATPGPSLPDERYRTHRAVRELLERVAATMPLVLVLDDVHWADAASIDLLAALLRRPPAAPVLIAMAARPRQVADRLSTALERAHRAGGLTRVALGPLRREDAGELLGGKADAAFADALYGLSGGNPFYLEQLARSLSRPGGPKPAATSITMAGIEVPPAVAASVTEELSLLSAGTRRVLQGAAVAGDPFVLELAAAAAAADEAVAAQAIDDLLAVGLIRPTDVPRRYRFRHPVIRRAVYESAPGGWLLGAHERCARELAQRGASAAARAHHVEHAARQGDDGAIALLVDAGTAAAPRAPAISARWFGAALRLLPENAPAARRLEILTARARVLAATGPLTAARADLLEAIGLLPEQAIAARTSLTAACAGIELLLGEHEQARARLAAALEQLPDRAGPEAVALMIELAIESLFGARYEAMRDWALDALDGARPLGAPALTATAVGLAALAEACTGRIIEAEARREEAVGLVDALPDSELATRLAAAGYLANAELYLDRYEQAAAHAGRGLRVAQATGQMVPTLMPALVTALSMCGRVAEAAGLLDGALESARVSGIPQAIAWTLVNQSFSLMAAGNTEAALACAEESLELTQGSEERFAAAWSGLAVAAALLAADHPARAADVLVQRAGGEEITALPASWRVLGLQLLTRCQVALGQREQAQRSLALAEATAESLGLPLAAAWADRAAADVALDTGEPTEAAQRALASAASAERAGAGIEAAISRTLAGQALALAGDGDRAVAELERAAAALDRCGAPRLRDAAERELRKLGRPVHRRTRKGSAHGTGVDTLTERERQVADLVVDRRTNPQIAAELFLSLKTVETHLRNIFRKLDVSSRVELARAVERARRSP